MFEPVTCDGCLQLLGAMAAPVDTDEMSNNFLGAQHLSAPVAELSAVAAVLSLVRQQVGPAAGLRWQFWVDATYVIDLLSWAAHAWENDELARFARMEVEAGIEPEFKLKKENL